MARIAVDGRFLGTGTGLANYTRFLLQALVAEGSHDYVVVVRPGHGLDLPVKTVEADFDHYSLAEQTRLPRVIASTRADLAFHPHFNAPMVARVPFVVTVHDLILHRHPGDASLPKQLIYRTLLRRNLRAAERVIAVSEWTRTDLVRHYGSWLDAKTVVSREGAGPTFTPRPASEITRARTTLGLTRDYLLYTGNGKPHKNLQTLVTAHLASGRDEDLVLVSGDPDAAVFEQPGVVIARGVDDDMLAALYSGARAFVTASLDEGYCLPVAEALACGCPVIATDQPAIRETASGHAMLLSPTVEAFTAALSRGVPPQQPVQVGDWAEAARRTVRAFDQALTGR